MLFKATVYGPKPDFKHGQIPFKFCVPQLEVQAPPGTTIGYVSQDWHPCVPKFSIKGANKETVMKLEGPCFACNCCGDVNFKVRGHKPRVKALVQCEANFEFSLSLGEIS